MITVTVFPAPCLSAQLNLQGVGIKCVQSPAGRHIPTGVAGSLPFLHWWPSENGLSRSKLRLNVNLSGDKMVMVIIFLTLYVIAYHLCSLKLHIIENLLVTQSSVGCSEDFSDKTDDKCTDNQIAGNCFLSFPSYKGIMLRSVWN